MRKLSAGAERGQAWLFCGCRRRQEDFLYGQEFQQFVAEGTLSQLHVAFSRAGPSKVYVQHLIREQVRLSVLTTTVTVTLRLKMCTSGPDGMRRLV